MDGTSSGPGSHHNFFLTLTEARGRCDRSRTSRAHRRHAVLPNGPTDTQILPIIHCTLDMPPARGRSTGAVSGGGRKLQVNAGIRGCEADMHANIQKLATIIAVVRADSGFIGPWCLCKPRMCDTLSRNGPPGPVGGRRCGRLASENEQIYTEIGHGRLTKGAHCKSCGPTTIPLVCGMARGEA